MEKTKLLSIWSRIRDELALLQDQAPEELRGQVLNPISGSVFSQNTSCAALVFATEYVRSGEADWVSRAQMALQGLKSYDVYAGLDEPKWGRFRWYYNSGSLFTTGTTLDTLWRTLKVLGMPWSDQEGLRRVVHYLETCMVRPGLFAHDSVKPGQTQATVQNTSAIALFIMETVATQLDGWDGEGPGRRDMTLLGLTKGQRSDGFWPYVHPNRVQQYMARYAPLASSVRRLPLVGRYALGEGDRSVFFGDAVHHCLTLYYLARSSCLRAPPVSCSETLVNGWAWVQAHLVAAENGGLRFDFDWEPTPRGFRYCNFRDTSTYFLILAMLPFLAELGVIHNNYDGIAEALLVHIDHDLLESKRVSTSIEPYEGPDEAVRMILPRVGEASAWKGALLAEFMLSKGSLGGHLQ